MELRADVKCYFCGHISGQIIGRRGETLHASSFVPRPGYGGSEFKPGERLRSERCCGPVFLEDVTPFAAAAFGQARAGDARRRRPAA